MTLQFDDGSIFARGACRYQGRPATPSDTYPRPFLLVSVEGQMIDAALDTGGFFLILKPEIAELLALDPNEGEQFPGLLLRGGRFGGRMHRVTLSLEAERGESFDVEVTAFVPSTYGDELPNFVGWPLCLERFRFAMEPDTDTSDGWFHFGPIDEA